MMGCGKRRVSRFVNRLHRQVTSPSRNRAHVPLHQSFGFRALDFVGLAAFPDRALIIPFRIFPFRFNAPPEPECIECTRTLGVNDCKTADQTETGLSICQ